ncbi:MAG: HEAT repeat domain-containing protein [Myxococcales bacterium]|nr:HEAT repeat domain-containing protein [Myxococcales bacterium]
MILSALATLLLAGATMLFGGSAWLESRAWRRAMRLMGRRARALGLTWDGRDAHRGRWHGYEVAVRVVALEHGVGARVYLRVPTRTLQVWSGRAPSRLATGDPHFDTRFSVRGTTADRALLSAPVRALLNRSSGPMEIGEGWVSWQERSAEALAEERLELRFAALAQVARSFDEAGPLGMSRIEALVTAEPVAGVRWRTLARLSREAPGIGRSLARRALSDRNAHVRWMAARIARDGPTLAQLCVEDGASVELRRRAAWDLVRLAGDTSLAPDQLLAVARTVASHPDVRLSVVAPHVASLAGRRAQALLVGLLTSTHRGTVRAAVQVLGGVGTPASLAHLRSLAYRTPLLGRLYPEIRAAMDQIRARCGRSAAGLSLVTGPSGREVSLVPSLTAPGGADPQARSPSREPVAPS